MRIDVRLGSRADVAALARVLGRAFHNDPVMQWLQPDPDKRLAALPGFFATVARHHFLAGGGVEVATSETGIGAAALWDPPGHWAQTTREQITMLPAVIRAFRGRLGAARALAEEMKANHPEEPHWYLAIIGSDPRVRGAGFGNALLRSRLDRCDDEGAPAYLESSNPDNIAYYHRFGFEVTGEIVAPGGGPSLWPMWRAPR
ncbi:MAG: GNAT family N-acetyltransferase [Mycobacterium sp.]